MEVEVRVGLDHMMNWLLGDFFRLNLGLSGSISVGSDFMFFCTFFPGL